MLRGLTNIIIYTLLPASVIGIMRWLAKKSQWGQAAKIVGRIILVLVYLASVVLIFLAYGFADNSLILGVLRPFNQSNQKMIPTSGSVSKQVENQPTDNLNFLQPTLIKTISSYGTSPTATPDCIQWAMVSGEFIGKEISNVRGKRIYIFNNFNNSENELRKISARLQSKKYNYAIIDLKTGKGLEELKLKILQNSGKIRVYTKEPGKNKSNRPIVLGLDSTVKDVAEKILKGFSSKVRETKIWGPSSKFAGQKVGLNHILKDLDVVEFKTR